MNAREVFDDARFGRCDAEAVVAAMRLADLGAPDDATALAMFRDLLDCAWETPGDDTSGPALLVARIREGSFRVTVADPETPAAGRCAPVSASAEPAANPSNPTAIPAPESKP